MRTPLVKTISLFLAVSAFLAAGASVVVAESPKVPGRYELQGVMEMAGILELKANSKYVAGFSYGAADWMEEGGWRLEGDVVILTGGKFKSQNSRDIPLLLPTGSRFKYNDGKLTSLDPIRKLNFLDPNKSSTSEGKMRVRGVVTKWDGDSLVVKTPGECIQFSGPGLSPELRQKLKVGKKLDAQIPYSAIQGSGSCL